MKTRKTPKKSVAKSKPAKFVPSDHPLQQHADKIRQVVHDALANAGIQDLSLRSMQFDSSPPPGCPDGQHAEKVCTRDPDGTETCTWTCVPN